MNEQNAVLRWLHENMGGIASEAVPQQPTMSFVAADSANYTNANRTANNIDAIVIHTVEGTATSAIRWFQNPQAKVSAHYVVSKSGVITQMVKVEDVAWTQTYYNRRAISIECEGRAADPNNWTEAMMGALAKLTAWLCYTYDVAATHPSGQATADTAQGCFNQAGLIGHSQIQPWNKSDPGQYFPWDRFVRDVTALLR